MQVKAKTIQVHHIYPDGGSVYIDQLPIKWKDFKKHGIRHRKDKATGKYFLTLTIKY